MKSEQINELAAALSKAQGQMVAARKDSLNPHFKNLYADLASVWDAIRGPLTANGLSVVQLASAEAGQAHIETTLMHSSGQFISGKLSMASGTTPQQIGSAITYARRYALSAMVGIAPDDDDGNEAQAAKTPAKKSPAMPVPASDEKAFPLPPCPKERFEELLPGWADLVMSGKRSAAYVCDKARSKYAFTAEQNATLDDLAASVAI